MFVCCCFVFIRIAASEYLDRAYAQIKEGQSKIAPYTDTFVSTIAETAANAQATVDADIAALKLETAQNVENLKNVLEKHRQEYQSLLEPAITEFREKLQPVMTQISEKMVTNVEETKEALLPIIQRVRTKIDEYIESMKGLINPYIEDYKETLMSAPSQAQSIKLEDMTALREKIKPMVDEINNNLQQIFATFSSTFMKN